MGVSENGGPKYKTLNSRILIIRNPNIRYPLFLETPIWRLEDLRSMFLGCSWCTVWDLGV